jgi:serine/threonine-protein kinase
VLERSVAVKQLSSLDADKLVRFRREALALAQLRHPHIVTVLDAGEDAETPFIVLEYVDGETLKHRLRRDGRLPIEEAIAYVIEVARALEAAHAEGIVHRDVKSQNILLGEDGGAKLTDFGIARRDTEVALTLGGRVLGTTDYVSPEQALGHEVGSQSDIYSLGVVLYETLVGSVPFSGDTQLAVAARHVREQLPDVQQLRPEVSAALAAVVDRATAKRVERRYRDAGAMIADLERALAIETARSGDARGEAGAVLRTLPPAALRRVPLHVRHRGSTIAAAITVMLLVAGAVAAFAFEGLRDTGARKPTHETTTYTRISLAGARATAYNPFGTGGADNASEAPQALTAQPGTNWSTNSYADGRLGKPGVGLYVTLAQPAAAGRLELVTSTPGFNVEVWGARRIAAGLPSGPRTLTVLGWQMLGAARDVQTLATIALDAPSTPLRYYLVWITRLEPGTPGGAVSAAISEISLLAEHHQRG